MAETTTTATVSAPSTPHQTEGEATAFGLDAGGWVALAMLVVFAIALYAKVPALIGRLLDKRIAGIRDQLDTAAKLRAEAEALKAEYETKAAAAHQEVEALRASASRQADEIVAKAKVDAAALIARHSSAAEEKIAAAERAAINEVRARAASAAAAAAEALIRDRLDAKADQALVDRTIGGLSRPS